MTVLIILGVFISLMASTSVWALGLINEELGEIKRILQLLYDK